LEERVGERRPIVDAAVLGDLQAGSCTIISRVLAENGGLLSLPLSSKGLSIAHNFLRLLPGFLLCKALEIL
jgi:hypothetical protein